MLKRQLRSKLNKYNGESTLLKAYIRVCTWSQRIVHCVKIWSTEIMNFASITVTQIKSSSYICAV